MKRIVAIMFVGVFLLLPATSSADPPGSLADRVAKLEALVASLQAELIGLSTFVTGLENYVTVDTTNNRITFTGVNLQLVNGTGDT